MDPPLGHAVTSAFSKKMYCFVLVLKILLIE